VCASVTLGVCKNLSIVCGSVLACVRSLATFFSVCILVLKYMLQVVVECVHD